jgi:Mg2+ and Co2+ transporter CorA
MLTAKQQPTSNAKRPKGAKMAETSINIIDALRGQQEQLKRLLAQKVLISEAPRPQLSEIEAQVMELKRLLNELEKIIQDQLKARP